MVQYFKRWRYQQSLRKAGSEAIEIDRLRRLPAHSATETDFMGSRIFVPDVTTYLANRDEILRQNTYHFRTTSSTPHILDVGANIGLSLIYHLNTYPSAKIEAFEPDPKIFEILADNLAKHPRRDQVTLHRQAVWTTVADLPWTSPSSDSGRLNPDNQTDLMVSTVRLYNWLNRRVDFLKVDIEGAETEVLLDCAQGLHHVQNLFVEYHRSPTEKDTLPDLLGLLRDHGFRTFLRDEHCPPSPLFEARFQAGFELQVNIWAKREAER